MKSHCILAFTVGPVAWAALALSSHAVDLSTDVQFRRLTLSEEFHSEGADFADFDRDGHLDIVSGPFWYPGPDFRDRHRYTAGQPYSIKAYSKHFFSFAHDFNSDGYSDILVVGMPGDPALWYQNPGTDAAAAAEDWTAHHVIDDAGGESPAFSDFTGDGKPELVCVSGGCFGYAQPNWQQPTQPWTFTAVSPERGLGRFTHGLGLGDVNGDGRPDLLETGGWYQQRSESGQSFDFHQQRFAQSGGSQMFAYDFDGDGDQDVVSVQNAHAWGLTWFERRGSGDDMLWVAHPILTDQPGDNEYGLAISQLHALALADIDGDGVKDLVTGKRFFAHGGGDPGAFQLPVLVWLRTVRSPGGAVRFEPHLIDRRLGVGTQLTVGDVNGDGRNDIVVGNKLGTFVLLNERGSKKESDPHSAKHPPGRSGDWGLTPFSVGIPPGTADFALGVRQSEPLTPEQERETFVLPPGFEAQLVAAEPEIAKPLNMAFDSRGRLWVTCTVEYPYPVEVGKPGRDSIKILEDQDGDGRADKIITFADGLNIPIGLYPYRDGVICYSIPYIWHLRDTDGDGKCDLREKLYGPFDHTRDTHGMCNAFTRGYDGWLYACHGYNNQSTVSGRDGNQVTMHSGNTFRIQLDGSRIEHYTHGQVNPFGMAYDRQGNLLTADCHTKPVTLLMQGGHYDSFGKPHDGLGFVPAVMDHLHGSTAIGGIAVCTDRGSFPSVYLDSAFGGNVMTSRVNRNSLLYRGGSLQAQEESDFLISGDPWFRPVDLQFGPDGALYVADFYNRIIGHYEEPLNHPGRDRTSGRIWKIVYRPNDQRRDQAPRLIEPRPVSLDSLDIAGLIGQLGAPHLTRRMLAADRIVDHYGAPAIDAVREAFQQSESSLVRIHSLWILFRLGAVTAAELRLATTADEPLVQMHAYHVIGELDHQFGDPNDLLLCGINDADPSVARAAVLAAARHPSIALVQPLLDRFRHTPPGDPHLRHAIRMSLRDQLRSESTFQAVAQQIPPDQIELIAGICLALKTPAAGQFVASHIDQLSVDDRKTLAEYIKFAINHVSEETVDAMVAVARDKFGDDRNFQLQLLRSIHDGATTEGGLPESIGQWAGELATDLLALDQQLSPLPWTFIPSGDPDNRETVWEISRRRQAADRSPPEPLWSSFPHGEQRTGIYRSATFPLPRTFSFWIAGHDGFPDKPMQQRNLVRVHDAETGEILASFSPPRNDTAELRSWNPVSDSGQQLTGREVYVELVDNDPGTAYAWLAVGRFSVKELNPSELSADRRVGADLAGRFRLQPLRDDLIRLARVSGDRETRGALTAAVAEIDDDCRIQALAETIRIADLDQPLQNEIIDAIDRQDPTSDLLARALKSATAVDQLRVARRLVSDRPGVESLLALVAAGQATNRLLVAPEIRSRLDAIATKEQQQQMESLVASLPDEDAQLAALIKNRRAAYQPARADRDLGQQWFAKHCAVCHQVSGQGAQIGPNLDGIGNRGLARICEDVLAPHRNVDAAFRSSTILTDDGRAFAGLVKGETDSQLILFDTSGKQQLIDKAAITTRKQSMLSPMPGNVAELLNESQFNDLLSYLLSLNH